MKKKKLILYSAILLGIIALSIILYVGFIKQNFIGEFSTRPPHSEFYDFSGGQIHIEASVIDSYTSRSGSYQGIINYWAICNENDGELSVNNQLSKSNNSISLNISLNNIDSRYCDGNFGRLSGQLNPGKLKVICLVETHSPSDSDKESKCRINVGGQVTEIRACSATQSGECQDRQHEERDFNQEFEFDSSTNFEIEIRNKVGGEGNAQASLFIEYTPEGEFSANNILLWIVSILTGIIIIVVVIFLFMSK